QRRLAAQQPSIRLQPPGNPYRAAICGDSGVVAFAEVRIETGGADVKQSSWRACSQRVFLAFLRSMEYHPATIPAAGQEPLMTPDPNFPRIYVDADACPVKDEIYRVAVRHGLPVSVVAGNLIRVPRDPLIERIAAGTGMDAADDWIAEHAGKGDIVITSDIPLASRCVKAGCEVIAPNGKPF